MPPDRITVTALSSTPVKGLRIANRSLIELERGRIVGDRLFYLVDPRGRMVNAKMLGALQTVTADFDGDEGRLALGFPDGTIVSERVQLGESLRTRFASRERTARIVLGPFSASLSEHLGTPVRLVAPADGSSAVDRGQEGAVTLISSGSLARLAEVAGADRIDSRRFRMSIEVDGVEPHAEDAWAGATVSVGTATLAIVGHVGRCAITTRNPDTGVVDLATLEYLRAYRDGASTTEPLPFGVYGSVLAGGVVGVGDEVRVH